jgi:nucleoside-diphosphate-sugar epimerase
MSIETTPMIAVFAATGSQGGAVTDALLARGVRVRALIRNPASEKAPALAARGVELAPVSVHDPPPPHFWTRPPSPRRSRSRVTCLPAAASRTPSHRGPD